MKSIFLTLLLCLIGFNSNAQDLMVINPQLHKNVVYRDIENVIYIPNIDQKKYDFLVSPECKIQKSKYVDESGMTYTCFKISEVPDVKFISLTLRSPGKSYGTFRFEVRPVAPKKN
jgi:hypothetical protein